MADYEQIMTALRNADAAGDTEAATRLAQMAREAQQTSTPQEAPSNAASAFRGFKNGATFGFGDEREALLTGGLLGGQRDEVGDFSLFNYGTPTRERIGQMLGEERATNDASKAENPIIHTASDIAGSVVPSLGLGPLVAGGKGMLAQGSRLMAGGAAEGATMGAGNADGADLAEAIVKGAAFGAGGALVAAPAASLLKTLGAAVANPIRGMMGESPTIANRSIGKAIGRSDQSPGDIHRSMMEARQDGQNMFTVADALGNPGQRMLAGTTRQPGAGRTEAVNFLDGRQSQQGRRLKEYLAEALGAPDTATQRTASLESSRARRANIAYGQAAENAAPVNLNDSLKVIDDVLHRDPIIGDSSLSQGELGRRVTEIRDQMANGGEQLIDFRRVLNLKVDIRRQMERNPDIAGDLRPLYRSLDNALEASSSRYRSANDSYRRQSDDIDAVEAGRMMRSQGARIDDNLQQISGMTESQLRSARSGYSDPILAKVENAPSGTNRARALTDDGVGDELNALALDPARINRQIGRENTMFETRRQATGGSQTADNLADQADVGGINASTLDTMRTGNVGGLITQALAGGINAASGKNEATRQLIARAMLSTDPEAALRPVINQIGKDQGSRDLIAAILRRAMTNPVLAQ